MAPGIERSAEAVDKDDRLARTPISKVDPNTLVKVAAGDGLGWNLRAEH